MLKVGLWRIRHRGIEHSILEVKLSNRVRNSTRRSNTHNVDLDQKDTSLKWNCVGHVCRMLSELWAKITAERILPNVSRRPGRHRRRWLDELNTHIRSWPIVNIVWQCHVPYCSKNYLFYEQYTRSMEPKSCRMATACRMIQRGYSTHILVDDNLVKVVGICWMQTA